MSYLSSPLWLILIVLFSADAVRAVDIAPVTYAGRYPVLAWPISHTVAFVSIAMATMGLLYLPKLLALLLMLRDPRSSRGHGGAWRLIFSVIIESIFSTLIAPIFMLSHSWFVATILLGRHTRWGAQLRGSDGIRLVHALVTFAPHAAIAIGAGTLVWNWTPGMFWWYLPLLVGPAIASIVAWATSKPSWGISARHRGLLLVPSETIGLPIVDSVESLIAKTSPITPALHDLAGVNSKAPQTT